MRATFCLLIALIVAGCSTVPSRVSPYNPPPGDASAAEWDAYAAAKRNETAPAPYPAWTEAASVLAKLAGEGVSFSR